MGYKMCEPHQFESGDRCCQRCNAGEYMKTECDGTKETECAKCECGFYTDSPNHVDKCHPCKQCLPSHKKQTLNQCTTKANTVCKCVSGYYCNNAECEHCLPVTRCQVGEGVKTPGNGTTNVICAPCGKGTFSNVTDYESPCKPHTRCEDYGGVLKIPGDNKSDAVCGNFKSDCHWMLPAGLWAGLVLTAIVIALIFILWRKKCKTYRAARSSICVTPVAVVPIPDVMPREQPSYCQETCIMSDCKLPIFNEDDPLVISCTEDTLNTSHPITPLKASVSFVESSNTNGNAGYCNNFFRSQSEPQEDEYCGT